MKTTLYFDMDGTLADFYSVKGWLEDLQRFDPRPYREAKPLVNPERFTAMLNLAKHQGYRIAICSWTSKNSSRDFEMEVAKVKKEWLKKTFPRLEWDEIHIIPYGTPKRTVSKNKYDCLFDDEWQNVASWGIGGFNADEMLEVLEMIDWA